MIHINNINVYYNKNNILKNISFKLEKGEILSIIGANGCGKTTLLKCIVNNMDYTGDIFIDGKNIKKMKRIDLAKKVCILNQISMVSFNYTVFDTVMIGRYAHQKGIFSFVDKKEDKKIAEDSLKLVGIYDMKDDEIDKLSGGQLQRVFLAKIIAQNPDIVLLDEPTNHLDIKYQIMLIQFLKQWAKKEGKIIISVLHDINLALNLSENILVLKNGHIEHINNYKKILQTDILKDIYGVDIKKFMLESLKKWEIY